MPTIASSVAIAPSCPTGTLIGRYRGRRPSTDPATQLGRSGRLNRAVVPSQRSGQSRRPVVVPSDQHYIGVIADQFRSDCATALACTTRAASYRRATTPGELVVALLVSRFGIDPASDSGNLREDLRLIQALQREFFTDPMVQAALAGVLSDLRDDAELGEVFYARFMAPRRTAVSAGGHFRPADRSAVASRRTGGM